MRAIASILFLFSSLTFTAGVIAAPPASAYPGCTYSHPEPQFKTQYCAGFGKECYIWDTNCRGEWAPDGYMGRGRR